MMHNTQSKEITFWKFLQENSIEIPIIQRDYAQGRIDKEYLRKTFIESLKAALDNNNNNQKLKLDFVYGTLENGKIYPLDGQQRLTTLWLLHWYIALRSGNLNEANCNILKNFTYETRISSREFCEQLCKPENWKDYLNLLKEGKDIDNIAGYIKDQYWFSSAWLQDPTISSMLNMLAGTKTINDDREDIMDGIEEAFTCSQIGNISTNSCAASEYWKKLTSDNCPIIFYYLPITDVGLTDDLYIKMNARGKQLSNFENLKADLIGYVQKESSKPGGEKWKKFLNVSDTENYLPLLLDTIWTGLFWENKYIDTSNDKTNKKPCKIDEIFFAFVNRFFWNELVLEHIKNSKGKEKLEDNKSYKYFNNSEDIKNFDMTIAYHGLNVYKYENGNIPVELFEKLIKILGNYINFKEKLGELDNILCCPFDAENNDKGEPNKKNKDNGNQFYFIPKYKHVDGKEGKKTIFDNDRNEISPITHLTQVQRVVFSAVCKFFYACEDIDNCQEKLEQWMRVVWNLVSGFDEKGLSQIRTVDTMLTAIEFINKGDLKCLEVYKSLETLDLNNTKSLKNSFYARCQEECLKAKLILDDSGWKSEFIDKEPKYRGSIRFLLSDANGDPTNMDTFKSKANKNILEDENFYTNLIKHCTSPDQLKEIVYASSDNAKITNLLNPNLLEPIHNMLMDKEPNGNDSIKDLREALINATKKINAKEIYRLREKEKGYYYFEVPYKRDQEEGLIFPK